MIIPSDDWPCEELAERLQREQQQRAYEKAKDSGVYD
jgi:hypothetical protein